jgi:hypothetical protein
MKPEKKASRKAVKIKAPAAKPLAGGTVQPNPKNVVTAGKPAKSPKAETEAPKAKVKPVRKAPSLSKPVTKPAPLNIPPMLLEGDAAAPPPVSGPGQRYALGPTPPGGHLGKTENLGELPESYGTQRLFLTARDPHWVYASWDLTREQQQKYNAQSTDGHLILRTYVNSVSEPPQAETHVHPESRHWFIHAGSGGTKYMAELGYRDHSGKWNTISTSLATLTPPEALSDDTSVQFATIPPEVKFETLLEVITSAVGENVPLAEAVHQLRTHGHKALPPVSAPAPAHWTPAQARALAEVVSMDSVRRVWMGSLEITELIRRHLRREVSSLSAADLSAPARPDITVSSLSSPFGNAGPTKSFWFNLNAELILYGATEPDAKVTIGGRAIKLRPDGTFSYRFALPDGQYQLPVLAVSVEGDDGRAAELHFSRATEYRGDVGAHSQDAELKIPAAASVS